MWARRKLGSYAYVDFGNDPVMGQDANVGNSTLYFGSLHPTVVGASYLAADLALVINKYLH